MQLLNLYEGVQVARLVPSTYQTASDLKLLKLELRQGGKKEGVLT